MNKAKYNLLVVAHPDDETIYFAGLLMKDTKKPWIVICVTDGNADKMGQLRQRQFQLACKKLGVQQSICWNFPDRFEVRLNQNKLRQKLYSLPEPYSVFTHGILGEYGHPHHQDVSAAVHEAFAHHPRLYSIAYNCYPERVTKLTKSEYRKKVAILSQVYKTETIRFSHLLPATFTEGFTRVGLLEIQALYRFFTKKALPTPHVLKIYRWYFPYLKMTRHKTFKRLF